MKKLFTLILFVLLMVTTYVIPVNTATFLAASPNNDIPANTLDPLQDIGASLSLTKLTRSDTLFSFAIDSARRLTENELDQLYFTALSSDDEGNIDTLSLADFDYEIRDEGLRKVYHIYALKGIDQTGALSRSLVFKVEIGEHALSSEQYLFSAADALAANGRTDSEVNAELVPIYYTLDDSSLSIPVYTALLPASNYYRSVLNTMAHTPNYPGLSDYQRFPEVSYVWHAAGVLELKFSEQAVAPFADPALGQAALNNLLNTFEASDRELIVNKISLLINNTKNLSAFGQSDLTDDFVIDRRPKVYLPYIHDQTTSWLVKHFEANEEFNQLVQQIFEAYQRPDQYGEGLFTPLLPSDVSLESAQIVGETARLTVGPKFIQTFQNQPAYAAAFLEGMALSLTDLDYIKHFELYHAKKRINELGGIDISQPIEAPRYFNVDRDYILSQ